MQTMALEIHSVEIHTAPLASATVMLLRDSALGPEVLMMRRHGNSNVLGGVHVFPGGKLDCADGEVAEDCFDQPLQHLLQALKQADLDAKTAASLYVTALRETFEECGLLLCDEIAPEVLQQARALLRDGHGFAAILQQLGLPLQTRHLAPWSRWITPRVPSVSHKRFDTRFFVAQGRWARRRSMMTTKPRKPSGSARLKPCASIGTGRSSWRHPRFSA